MPDPAKFVIAEHPVRMEFVADVWRRRGAWLARAPAFGLTQDAATADEACKLLADSVAVFLGYAAEHGKLGTVLRQRPLRHHRGAQQRQLVAVLPLASIAGAGVKRSRRSSH